MLKITQPALNDLYREWVEEFGDGRDNNDWRFGQFIFNHFATGEDPFPSLFHTESAAAAYTKATLILQGQENG